MGYIMVNTDSIQTVVVQFISEAEQILDRGLANIYISTSIKLFLGLYAALAAPKLPKVLLELMNSVVVRVIWAAVIVVMATKDPSIAIITAIAFIVTLEAGNKMKLYDTSASISNPGETSWLYSAKNNEESPLMPDMGPLTPVVDMAETAIYTVADVANTAITNVADVANNIAPDANGVNTEEESEEIQPFIPHNNHRQLSDVNMMRNSNLTEGLNINAEEEISAPSQLATYTSDAQFKNAQNNLIDGSNQKSCVKSWENQHCAQGVQSDGPQ